MAPHQEWHMICDADGFITHITNTTSLHQHSFYITFWCAPQSSLKCSTYQSYNTNWSPTDSGHGHSTTDCQGRLCKHWPCYHSAQVPKDVTEDPGKYPVESWKYTDRNEAQCFVPPCFILVGGPMPYLPAVSPGGIPGKCRSVS